ncbi:MAG TPA: hypothetical protein VGH78_05705 [Solirubrobacteraceae bacterium]
MSRRLRHLTALFVVAISMCGMNIAVASAGPPPQGGDCVDHFDQGTGNIGDPGDGQEHHNESQGVGNAGDPGNGVGHFCPNE